MCVTNQSCTNDLWTHYIIHASYHTLTWSLKQNELYMAMN